MTITQTANCRDCGKLLKRTADVVYICRQCFEKHQVLERDMKAVLFNLAVPFLGSIGDE